MVDEKVYVIGDKRYLMLYDSNADDAFVAFEDDGFLKRVDESYPNYKDIFELLVSKIDDK